MNENLNFANLKDAADSGERDAAFRLAKCYENGDGVAKSDARAAYYYSLASDLGERRADLKLGELYLTGKGVERNDELAKQYFLKAGTAGIAEAYLALGQYIEQSKQVRTSIEKSATSEKKRYSEEKFMSKYEEKRLAEDKSVSRLELGDFAEEKTLTPSGLGNSFEKIVAIDTLNDNSVALSDYARFYRLAAEGGDAEGAYRYAEILKKYANRQDERKYWLEVSDATGYALATYELGIISEERKEYEKAFDYYLKSAESGVAEACFACGRFYERGLACQTNPECALRYYLEAYRKGIKEASFPIAKSYFEGKSVKRNYEIAKTYLNVAMDTNIPNAWTFAAQMTEHGRYGTKQDETLAAEYYRRAAELGDEDGKALYGKTLILGIGNAVDYEKAFRVVSEAAESGSAYGKYYLAYCKEKGFGTKIKISEAIEDYRTAAGYGIFEAAERLKLLEEKLRCKN